MDYGELLTIQNPAIAAEIRRLWDAIRAILSEIEDIKARLVRLEQA